MSPSVLTPLAMDPVLELNETYADLPRRSLKKAAACTMLVGAALALAGVALLGVTSPQAAMNLVAARPVTINRPIQTRVGPMAAARPITRLGAAEEEEEMTVGELLRGGKAKKKAEPGAPVLTGKLADVLRVDDLIDDGVAKAQAQARSGKASSVPDVEIPPSKFEGTEGFIAQEEGGITRTSFGAIASTTGLALLAYGFGAYFQLLPFESASAVMLIYGFPASLIGAALKYAELKPLECKTTPEALKLRESQATDIQKQIREDVTRYRYGDEQHMEEATQRIFQLGRPNGLAKNVAPKLVGIQEQAVDGKYALILNFKNDDRVPLFEWTSRQEKIESFFGPGITAVLGKTAEGVDVCLISAGDGTGRNMGIEQADLLPPLMPGLPGRRTN